jgi:hypothetical protein
VCRAEALRCAAAADPPAAAPETVVAVWLSVLSWLPDARWKQSQSGLHTDALMDLLASMAKHVTALRLADPARAGGERVSRALHPPFCRSDHRFWRARLRRRSVASGRCGQGFRV